MSLPYKKKNIYVVSELDVIYFSLKWLGIKFFSFSSFILRKWAEITKTAMKKINAIYFVK